MRTPFQRDRDRIVHSKAFRRLKHKTQVFIAPGGRPLPDPAHAHARDLLHRADGRAGAGAERGPDRGDRAGARPRPPAVRPHRRGGARPGAARARRAELPAQPALASGGGRAGARRARAQPDRAGARRDPQPHRARRSRRRSRGGWCGWSTGSPTSTTTSTTRCGRGSSSRTTCPAAEIELLGPTGGEADRHARARHRRAVARGRGHRPERGGRRGDAAAAEVHVRAGLSGRGGAERARAGAADAARPVRPLHGAPRGGPRRAPPGPTRCSGSPTTSPG